MMMEEEYTTSYFLIPITQHMLKADCYHHNTGLKLPKMEEEPSAPHTMMPSYWNGTTGGSREPYQLTGIQGTWA